jgi:quinoprotein glucose dehydrogenase
LETAVALEAIEAALSQSDRELAAHAAALLAPGTGALVHDRRWALEGGDPEAGRLVFQTHGDCQRCHGDGVGHDAGVGPSLAGVGKRGARYVLESMLDPQAEIAAGFGSVVVTLGDGTLIAGLLVSEDEKSVTLDATGQGSDEASTRVISRTEIASMSEAVTGMPPIGLGLEPGALRDVVAYVMSLEQ